MLCNGVTVSNKRDYSEKWFHLPRSQTFWSFESADIIRIAIFFYSCRLVWRQRKRSKLRSYAPRKRRSFGGEPATGSDNSRKSIINSRFQEVINQTLLYRQSKIHTTQRHLHSHIGNSLIHRTAASLIGQSANTHNCHLQDVRQTTVTIDISSGQKNRNFRYAGHFSRLHAVCKQARGFFYGYDAPHPFYSTQYTQQRKNT